MASTLVQQIYSRNVTLLQTFSSMSGSNLVQLYAPGFASPYDRVNVLKYYGFITSLRMKVDVNSIPESEIPSLPLTDSRTERITAVRDLEWRSPRKEIEFYLKTSRSAWFPIFKVSLLNRIPYYQINLLPLFGDAVAFEVGNDARIAARITDAGYGLLNNSDSITIFGSAQEEAMALPEQETEISMSSDLALPVTDESSIVLPANPNRKQLILFNNSPTHDCFLSYNGSAVLNRGIPLKRGGGTYEINKNNPYKGLISGIGTGELTLFGFEAV